MVNTDKEKAPTVDSKTEEKGSKFTITGKWSHHKERPLEKK